MHSPKYPSPDATPSPFPLLSPSIVLVPTVCLRPGASEAADDGRGGAAAAAGAGHESGGGGEGRGALPTPGVREAGHRPAPCLVCGHGGSFPQEEGRFWGLPEAGACTRDRTRLLALRPASEIASRQMETRAVPAPCPRTGRDSIRLRPIQPPRPQGGLRGVFCIHLDPLQSWLPSSSEGFWSEPPHSSSLPAEVLGGDALPSAVVGEVGGGPAASPGLCTGLGGSVGPGAPSHRPVLSNQAKRSAGKQHQAGMQTASELLSPTVKPPPGLSSLLSAGRGPFSTWDGLFAHRLRLPPAGTARAARTGTARKVRGTW